eukprot:GHVU01193418.1.p1 GENE.GHVU01193418.1~~GHVU01193418.1.p1  ORF type:complete len:157 (+),score=12.62 GHVU01193418.1:398-868(+)
MTLLCRAGTSVGGTALRPRKGRSASSHIGFVTPLLYVALLLLFPSGPVADAVLAKARKNSHSSITSGLNPTGRAPPLEATASSMVQSQARLGVGDKALYDTGSYTVLSLANGLKAITIHDEALPGSAFAVTVGCGFHNDPDDLPGAAHLLEHMVGG